MMSSKIRLTMALDNQMPDRLPVTTHHVMPYFLDNYMHGISFDEFFDQTGMDPITWTIPMMPDASQGEYLDPSHTKVDFLEANRILSDNWRIVMEDVPDKEYQTKRFTIITPKGKLSMITQSNAYTTWVKEPLIKKSRDIDLIGEYATTPVFDIEKVNQIADEMGDKGIVRGHIPTFDVFGQPGAWQDACCLVDMQELIIATFKDPEWVHELLQILLRRKLHAAASLKGARYDVLELGGGSASTTVISPAVFENFVAPYDSQIIAAAHEAGQRIAYHTCGGMMPILEAIADMNPDAMETFTPPGMGADVDLAEAKMRIGHRVCMIGGFDQSQYFLHSTPEETRAAVRSCFEAAGENGGFILAPSDHFFDAKPELIMAFADEARKCTY